MCTKRKATGEYVLACFLFATMEAEHTGLFFLLAALSPQAFVVLE